MRRKQMVRNDPKLLTPDPEISKTRKKNTMKKRKDTLTTTRARVDVIEAKLDQLLKKFGFDDETLWDIRSQVFEMALKPAQFGTKIVPSSTEGRKERAKTKVTDANKTQPAV